VPSVFFPYGKEFLSCAIPDSRFRGELVSRFHHYKAGAGGESLVRKALANPTGVPLLSETARGKNKVVFLASDHTRPVPSRIIVPLMLEEIRRGNPRADITILVATGCHRDCTQEELTEKFGEDIVNHERIIIHNCDSPDMVNLGRLPSGGELVINRIAVEADLLVSEGFIEAHFFAGFSGGPKSVLPGIAGRKTVVYNHNAEFIAHPLARIGVLDGNPVHRDIIFAARKAGLAFICNVVINSNKEIIHAIAGDCDLAHRAGADFLSEKCTVKARPADIVITSNGGYPLDQNIYQAVKGMTAAEASVKQDGVIIMIAKSNDGHGAGEFFKTFAEEKDLDRMLDTFMKTPKEYTRPDQWQSQIFIRVLKRARVIFISEAPDDLVKTFHMIPAHSLEEALKRAEEILGDPRASVTAIPDGVSVIVEPA
jgi:nickel-dependent lactate racemase